MKAPKEPKATPDEQRARLRELALSYHDLSKNCDIPIAQQGQMIAMWQVLTGYADTGTPAQINVLYDFWAGVAFQADFMTGLLNACAGSPEILRHVAEHAVRRLKSGKPPRWKGWSEYIRDLCGSEVSQEVEKQVVIAVIRGATINVPTSDGRVYGGLWMVTHPRLGQPGAVEFVYGDAIHDWAAIEADDLPAPG